MGLQNLIWYFLVEKGGFGRIIGGRVAKKLRTISDFENIESMLRTVYGFDYYGVRIFPLQIKSEIKTLLEMLSRDKPRTVLEIGIDKGGTLFLFSKIANRDATIIGIDNGYAEWREPIYASFTSGKQKLRIFRNDSHSENTLRLVKRYLRNRKVDFLFIDGDHTYDGVKKDFEMYRGLMKKGGVVAFHDIASNSKEDDSFVKDFFDEVKNKYRYREIIERES